MTAPAVKPPDASRQVSFHERLVVARKIWLMDALSDALLRVDPMALKAELMIYVPTDVQRILASSGIRDEHVFPAPSLLVEQPTLVGYYRLLIGVPQKSFYAKGTGMSTFKSMESKGSLSSTQRAALPEFCTAMSVSMSNLVRRITPAITTRDVKELPLLTLGQFFQGGNNNVIGQAAIKAVFRAIGDILDGLIKERNNLKLLVENKNGTTFVIAVSGDQDIRIQEVVSARKTKNILAIEVKGGVDKSNVYNRGGEAEKSHRIAKTKRGYNECWTIINMKEIDLSKLKEGSSMTDVWFDTAQVVAKEGTDWDDFERRILGVIESA